MEAVLIEMLKGVPVAAVLLYFAILFRQDLNKWQDRYEALVNKNIDEFNKKITEVAVVIAGNSEVMKEAVKKLNEKH